MNVSDEVIRAAFEKFASEHGWNLRPYVTNCGIIGETDYGHPSVRAAWSAFRAAFSIAIPDGWKIVPVEATAGMAFAGSDAVNFSVMTDNARVIYDAMLNTAPQPDYTK